MSSYLTVNIFIFFNNAILESEKLVKDKSMIKQEVGDELNVCVIILLS